MEYVDISRFFFSFALVVGLIWVLALLAKRFGLDKKLRGTTSAKGRLSIADVMYIDPKRKLLLVKADQREYLLLVAGDTVSVIDQLNEANHA